MTDPGSLFMLGVYGQRPTREMVKILKDTNACGVLLLARNIDTPSQTKALTQELQQRLGRPLLFAVDHEGGWVLRFKSGITAFPGNAALGLAKDPKLARSVGLQMARELRPLGIHINLAPVLDVLTKNYNPGIGMRSFGNDPKLVARLGAAMIQGLQEGGVSACAKHFPGKGAATVDAHVDLPTIRLPRLEFQRDHLFPFIAAVKAGVDCVMTSHVRFPALDRAPATFSPKITKAILRDRLGFDGVIIADDLCMGAVTRYEPVATAAAKAFEAGHDILLVAHNPQAQLEAVECFRGIAPEGLDVSRRRIERLHERKTRGKPPRTPALALGREIAVRAIETIQNGTLRLPLRSNGSPLLILFPDFAEVSERFTFENGPRGPEREIKAAAARWGPARLRRVPVESKELGGLSEAVRRAPRVLFFCFEAMRFPGQEAVLNLLKKEAADKTAVCLIRNSYDRAWLSPKMTAVDAHGYRLFSLRAALDFLLSEKPQ